MSGEGSYAPKSPDLSSFFTSGPTAPPPTSGHTAPLRHPSAGAPYQAQQTQHGAFLQHQYQQPPPPPPPTTYYPQGRALLAAGSSLQAGQSQRLAQPHPQHPQHHGPRLLLPHNSTPAHTAGYSPLSPHSPHHPYLQPQPVSLAQPAAPPPAIQAFQQPRAQPASTQPQPGGGYRLADYQAALNQYQQAGGSPAEATPAWTGYGQQPAQQAYDVPSPFGLQRPFVPEPGNPVQPQSQLQSQFQAQPQPSPQAQPRPRSQPHSPSDIMPTRRAAAASSSSQPAAIEPSPVRTKFPTARIKRIMQADEEVGKVAQQTPIAVGKALEMFMVALVTKSAEVAKEKSSKRVTAAMLKQVVESDEQWDFLREIVSKVDIEEKAGKGKSKADSESEEEVVEKKKGKGGRKKKI